MSRRLHAFHVSLYRRWMLLFPPEHRRRFGDEQVQLFADALTQKVPFRAWLQALPDLLVVLRTSSTRGHVLRVLFAAASGVPLLLAITIVADLLTPWRGFEPAIAAAGLLATQGLLSIRWLTARGKARRFGNWAFGAWLGVAALASIAFGVGAVGGLRADLVDPEFGVVLITLVVGTHAVLGLTTLVSSREHSRL